MVRSKVFFFLDNRSKVDYNGRTAKQGFNKESYIQSKKKSYINKLKYFSSAMKIE